MSYPKRLGAFALTVLLATAMAMPVLGADDGNTMTVGRFVQRLAQSHQLEATDPAAAAGALERVGIRLPQNLDFQKTLTERDVATIGRSAGLDVTTNRPDATFGRDRVERFFMTFASEFTPVPGKVGGEEVVARGGATPDGESGNSNGNGPPFDPYTKGKGGSKGKKKGHRSPTDPE